MMKAKWLVQLSLWLKNNFQTRKQELSKKNHYSNHWRITKVKLTYTCIYSCSEPLFELMRYCNVSKPEMALLRKKVNPLEPLLEPRLLAFWDTSDSGSDSQDSAWFWNQIPNLIQNLAWPKTPDIVVDCFGMFTSFSSNS